MKSNRLMACEEVMQFVLTVVPEQYVVWTKCARVVPKVMSNFFFFAWELGTADEGECGGRWNQLLCYP